MVVDGLLMSPPRARAELHHGDVAQVHTFPVDAMMQTQSSALPASEIVVQTSLPVPVVHGVVHGSLSATPPAHIEAVALA